MKYIPLFSFYLFISSFQIVVAQEVKPDKINQWISQSIKTGDFYENQKEFVASELKDYIQDSENPNAIYDLARALHQGLQKGLQQQKNVYAPSSYNLFELAEELYLAAIKKSPKFGRANAMLGLLYNQQKEYDKSSPYLEVALGMQEGSEDWLVAANQYLFSGAEMGNTTKASYQEVYKKFKKYAPKSSQSYYQKMAELYKSYYE